MAGRYDSNPFDEEEVNPFAVSFLFFYLSFDFLFQFEASISLLF